MKIGIDVSQVAHRGGVSVYTQNLVNALFKIDRGNEYRLFFASLRKKFPASKFRGQNDNLKSKTFMIPPTVLDFLWNRLHIWPVENFIGGVDVFHASDWTQPPAKKARLVTTIHDLSFLRWPESAHSKVLAVQKRRLGWVKKEADQIIAVSEATKKEIITLLEIPEEKITVVYEGAPADLGQFKVQSEKLKAIKGKFAINRPYIFAYGSRAPRKNMERLIKAFGKIRERRGKLQLVIVGDYRPENKPPTGIVLTGFLPRGEMLTLFSRAEAFVYPSLYEGFGLPILESFTLGVPVITSRTSSMAEVAGGAALLVDPKSTESIKKGVESVLCDVSIHRALVERGRERLKLFSWEKTARETLAVYEKAMKK